MWAPFLMSATVGNNLFSASPVEILNQVMQEGNLGHVNAVGEALMEGAPLHHHQMWQQFQCSYNKRGVSMYHGLY